MGDYGIKDRTDRVCKVELLSKTGRWAMQLELELLTSLQSQSPRDLAVGAGSRRVVLEAEGSSVAAESAVWHAETEVCGEDIL